MVSFRAVLRADHTADAPVLHTQVLHQRIKPYLSAETLDFFTNIFDNQAQHICPDMWLLLV